MQTHIIRLFILLGTVFPALASTARKRPANWAGLMAPLPELNPEKTFKRLSHHFRLLVAGLALCFGLGALSTNAFALMGGAVQNGNVALGNASNASGVTVSTLAGSAGVTGSTDGTGAAARFNYPMGITTDGTNLYVVEQFNKAL
jgi:hypothetical protein